MIKKKILVAMSGGVDSSVAAALLKEAGHEVAGATIRTWMAPDCPGRQANACCGFTGMRDAREVAETLGIPFWIFNFEKEFKKLVMDHFAEEYLKGRTPNPCVDCNEHIKFRLFWERAKELGFDDIATGHYARVGYDETTGCYFIREGTDGGKDQSYVLFPLGQDLLAHLHLPVGDFEKNQIREWAKEKKLRIWDKPDSQEICFVPDDDYGAFLTKEYFKNDIGPGVIRLKDGSELGRHDGFFHYTRGQRRGLRVAYRERLYVIGTDPKKNEVILGTKKDMLNRGFFVSRLHWFLKPDFSRGPVKAQVKIRSQHAKSPAVLEDTGENRLRVVFDEAQDSITPGQAAVFYREDRSLGGGWIDTVEDL